LIVNAPPAVPFAAGEERFSAISINLFDTTNIVLNKRSNKKNFCIKISYGKLARATGRELSDWEKT
jgi:hypothetical protein